MVKSQPRVTAASFHSDSNIDNHTRNVLVTLTGTEETDRQLVREAGAYAVATGGRLVLLSVMSTREFEERRRAYAQSTDLPRYTLSKAEETRRRSAVRIAVELDPLGVDHTVVGAVGRETDQVLSAAQTYDCGHVFLVHQPQSVFRRLVSGDSVRAIAREFDGLVTELPNHSPC